MGNNMPITSPRPMLPHGYRPPMPPQGYRPPMPPQGYRPPMPPQGYNQPMPPQGYNQPMPPQGYRPPMPPQGYNQQVPTPYRQQNQPYQNMNEYPQAPDSMGMYAPKSRLTFILLGLFLGGLGIHWFYLGNTTRGIIYLLVTLLTFAIGGGIVTGILTIIDICTVKTDMQGYPLV